MLEMMSWAGLEMANEYLHGDWARRPGLVDDEQQTVLGKRDESAVPCPRARLTCSYTGVKKREGRR